VHRAAGDLALMAAIGIVGFLLRLIGAPVAPVMIGLILGPAAEQHLRRALSISQGDWTVFVTHPLSAGLLAVALALAVWGAVSRRATSPDTA
jgi:putative tricarboxylic transport membrane protein